MSKLTIAEIAKKYIESGYSVIPVSPVTKQPTITSWTTYQKAPMSVADVDTHFKDGDSIALLCGGKSRVFCLDADMKYDLSEDLWVRFKEAVPNSILKKMMLQSTQNKGYHLVCKIPESRLKGNEKFASRYTTAFEKHITYTEAFSKPTMRDKALNIALQDKARVLFESRSGTKDMCKGYFLIAPSKGYKKIYGKIQEITEEEYDTLIEITRSFNEVVSETKSVKVSEYQSKWTVSPFDDYNKNGDVVQLLCSFGWEVVYSSKAVVRFKRPGVTHTSSSALYDCDTKVFNVFSTSVSFDVSKGYNPSSVFMHLEANDDAVLAFKKLIDLGYGVK